MADELLKQLPSFGVAGLLFVMWWFERQERSRAGRDMRDALRVQTEVSDVNDHLLDVIRTNTEALTALREELRSHRVTEVEWISRLGRQLEKLAER